MERHHISWIVLILIIAGDSLITSFLVGYTDRIKKGEEKSEAIKNALADAAKFASEICGLEGAFGYGRHYE